jgi:hypothetical protein
VGYGTSILKHVCRTTFQHCYDIGHTLFDQLIAEIKNGVVSSQPLFSDKTKAPDDVQHEATVLDRIVMMNNPDGPHLSREQLAAIKIPNSSESLNCYAWMKFHFSRR